MHPLLWAAGRRAAASLLGRALRFLPRARRLHPPPRATHTPHAPLPRSRRSHLAKRLKSEGHYIIGCDWKRNEHMPEEVFCDEFHLADLRVFDNCLKVCKGADHVFNLAADMGGMGFIQSNHSVIMCVRGG